MSDALSESVGARLTALGLTIATAESCTGGLVLHRLTNIPGSSAYVLGGIVAYANGVKQMLLHVPPQTLAEYGAVSEQTAAAMLAGVLTVIEPDIALSLTGIAGPGGGSPEKPVGLVYIGAQRRGSTARIERHIWPGDREAVKWASATRALEMALALLTEDG